MALMRPALLRFAPLAAVTLLPWTASGEPPPSTAAGAPAPPAVEAPADFGHQARLLYRLVACTGEPLPAEVDPLTVQRYCARQGKALEAARGHAAKVGAFLAGLRPADLPPAVVYPFGGGDLLTALTAYPEARDYTTLSLEHAGDPRRLPLLADRKVLAASLELIRATSVGLLQHNDSRTDNLMKGQRGELPGQLAFFMLGLAVHGYEPVQLRFFRIEPDGTLRYLTSGDIAAAERQNARLLRPVWTAPDFSPAFSNSELVFVRRGDDPATGARIHRHVAFDLSNDGLKRNPGLLAWLEGKGPIAAMTKAASYLLWQEAFSTVRSYLTGNMFFMVSDSTGVPPRVATAAGFSQETWGSFEGSFLPASERVNGDFRALWARFPKNRLPFRFGYLDASRKYHLLVTRRAAAAPGPARTEVEPRP